MAFSPDGNQALTGSWDGSARLFDLQSGQELRRFAHEAGVGSVAFSPDGKQVLVGSGDGSVALYDLDLDALLTRAARTIQRRVAALPSRPAVSADVRLEPLSRRDDVSRNKTAVERASSIWFFEGAEGGRYETVRKLAR